MPHLPHGKTIPSKIIKETIAGPYTTMLGVCSAEQKRRILPNDSRYGESADKNIDGKNDRVRDTIIRDKLVARKKIAAE